ncbi:MAG: heme exporter protein CcmD [Oceanococcaceae bacterium]
MMEFLMMGGYARYLWPSFAVFVALLVWMAASSIGHHRRALRMVPTEPPRRTTP